MKSPFKIFRESTNSFQGEESEENVRLLLRRHPLVMIIRLFSLVIFFLVPIVIDSLFSNYILYYNIEALFIFLTGVWFLLLWQVIFYSLTMYTLDVWIVTNHRIIDNTQNGFFNRTTSELHLSRIQDISVNMRGVIPTFFHFGDLQIQTAGAEEKFLFMQVPNPEKVKDEIMKIASNAQSV